MTVPNPSSEGPGLERARLLRTARAFGAAGGVLVLAGLFVTINGGPFWIGAALTAVTGGPMVGHALRLHADGRRAAVLERGESPR